MYKKVRFSIIKLILLVILGIPLVQVRPIQPALQEHIPSVFLHVLQLGEHTLEQFLPKNPLLQARGGKKYINITLQHTTMTHLAILILI